MPTDQCYIVTLVMLACLHHKIDVQCCILHYAVWKKSFQDKLHFVQLSPKFYSEQSKGVNSRYSDDIASLCLCLTDTYVK